MKLLFFLNYETEYPVRSLSIIKKKTFIDKKFNNNHQVNLSIFCFDDDNFMLKLVIIIHIFMRQHIKLVVLNYLLF